MDRLARADRRVRETTVAELGKMGGAVPAVAGVVVELLAEGLASNDWGLVAKTSESLEIVGSRVPAMAERVVELLTSRLVDPDQFVRIETIRALAEVGCSAPRAGKRVVELLKGLPDEQMARRAWDWKINDACWAALARISSGSRLLAETAADEAIQVAIRHWKPEEGVSMVAERFSDSVRIQRRDDGWAVAGIDRLGECGEIDWRLVQATSSVR
jgi:hypothetical protein